MPNWRIRSGLKAQKSTGTLLAAQVQRCQAALQGGWGQEFGCRVIAAANTEVRQELPLGRDKWLLPLR